MSTYIPDIGKLRICRPKGPEDLADAYASEEMGHLPPVAALEI